MPALGRAAADVLGSGFNAQECARILYAMGKSGVECPELTSAAGEPQDLEYTFPAPVGAVALKQQLGGTGAKWDEREGTGAIAGNGGALFEDSYVLAEWLARQSGGPSSVLEAAGMLDAEPKLDFGDSWNDVVAVELGAGIGLCSVVSSRLGMKVIATDGDESVLDQLAANAARNSSGAGKLQPALLKWGDDAAPLEDELETMTSGGGANGGDGGGLPGLVMATGCVYGRDAGVWAALAKTLAQLSGPNTIIILAHGTGAAPGVHQLRGDFYALCSPHFHVGRVPMSAVHPDHQGVQLHVLRRKPGT